MRTSYMVPGYAEEKVHWLKSELYLKASKIKEKSALMGRIAGFVVAGLNEALSVGVAPVELIEAVAFTAFNLVGMLFGNRECAANLRYCFSKVWLSAINCASLVYLWYPKLFIYVNLTRIAVSSILNFIKSPSFKEESDYERLEYFRLRAIHAHGPSNIQRLEEKLGLNEKKDFRENVNDYTILLAKLINHIKPEDFQSFLEQTRARSPSTSVAEKETYEFPIELQTSPDAIKADVMRILRLTEGLQVNHLSSSQKRAKFCSLLNLSTTATNDEIKQKYRLLALKMHPDKGEKELSIRGFVVDALKQLNTLKTASGF